VQLLCNWFGAWRKATGFNNRFALEANLLKEEYFTPIVIVVILTTLVMPPMLKKVFGQN
jgi:hypothetical protein